MRRRAARRRYGGATALRTLLGLGLLAIMLGGSLAPFRKELWSERPAPIVAAVPRNDDEKPPTPALEIEFPPEEAESITLPIGVGPSGLQAEGKIHRTKNFKSHQEAVDMAKPGDAVIFDSTDARPVVVLRNLRDIQFISGSASWELHGDLVDCQFLFHEAKKIDQREGRLERCVFFRCPMKNTNLIHADAVSFYFDEHSPLHPKDNPSDGKAPILFLPALSATC